MADDGLVGPSTAMPASRVTYLARRERHVVDRDVRTHGDRWEFSEGGQCPLQVALRTASASRAGGSIPRRLRRPTATTIRILGTEAACANGKAPSDGSSRQSSLARDDAVTIAVLVRNVPGGADCPGNPEFPQAVELAAPLGDRPLFDGSTVPPTARS